MSDDTRTWVVRPAREDDLPRVSALAHELGEFQAPWRVFDPRPGYEADLVQRYRAAVRDPGSLLLVAEDGRGDVVGMAMGHVHVPSSVSDQAAVEVSSVLVEESARGLGIGRAMASEIARFARRRGVSKLTLRTFAGNQAALEFWQRIGFRPRLVQLTADPEDLAPRAGGSPGAAAAAE